MRRNNQLDTGKLPARDRLCLLVLVVALAGASGCGVIAGGANPNGYPQGLILDAAAIVVIYDIETYLGTDELPGVFER